MQLLVSDILSDALSLAGATAIDEPATASEQQLALRTVNVMLDKWSANRLLLRSTTELEFTTTANKSSYTVAASGADITAPKPLRVLTGYYRQNNVDTPVEIITIEEYDNLTDKSVATGPPTYIAYDPGAAQQSVQTGTFYIYLTSDQPYLIHLETDSYLTEFASVTDTVSFAPAYYEAIIYNLAVRLFRHFHPSKAGIPADIVGLANSSLNTLRALNAVRIQASVDYPGKPAGAYDIYADTWT